MFDEELDLEELLDLAEKKQYLKLKERLVDLNEVDIALFIEELDSEKTVVVFRMLPKALATEVFAELPVDKQSHICLLYTSIQVWRFSDMCACCSITTGDWRSVP